jgi:hypothetical protein
MLPIGGTLLKAVATVAFIVFASELSKRSSLLTAVMVGLPLATILIVAFRAAEPGGVAGANAIANSTFLMFWPGLAFFVVLNVAQRFGIAFWWSFASAVIATGVLTWGCTTLYQQLGWVTAEAKPVLPAETLRQ